MSFAVMGFNDKWIVSGGDDGAVRIQDNTNNNKDGIARSRGGGREICWIDETYDEGVTNVASNEDGTILITSIVDKYVIVQDVNNQILY